jgi:hypothetical protein
MPLLFDWNHTKEGPKPASCWLPARGGLKRKKEEGEEKSSMLSVPFNMFSRTSRLLERQATTSLEVIFILCDDEEVKGIKMLFRRIP